MAQLQLQQRQPKLKTKIQFLTNRKITKAKTKADIKLVSFPKISLYTIRFHIAVMCNYTNRYNLNCNVSYPA